MQSVASKPLPEDEVQGDMAHYAVTVRTPLSVSDAFDYIADLSNFAEWDPGVREVSQVEGDGTGLGSAYDVTVEGIAGPLTLRYVVTEFTAPDVIVAKAQSTFLTSLDTITVRSDGDGSTVTYDAILTLNGPLGLADVFLAPAFKKIGDKAAAGLEQVLDGRIVETVS